MQTIIHSTRCRPFIRRSIVPYTLLRCVVQRPILHYSQLGFYEALQIFSLGRSEPEFHPARKFTFNINRNVYAGIRRHGTFGYQYSVIPRRQR